MFAPGYFAPGYFGPAYFPPGLAEVRAQISVLLANRVRAMRQNQHLKKV